MPRTGLSAEALKKKAVSIAHDRISTMGYEKLRVTDVAAELGVSHAALYGHFADKAALLDAVVEQWLAETIEQLEPCLQSPGSAEERLETWMILRLRLKRSAVRDNCRLFQAYCSATDRLRDVVQDHLDRIQAQLAQLLAEAVPGLPNPMQAAGMLRVATTHYSYPWLVIHSIDTPDPEIEAELRRLLQCLLSGLRAQTATDRSAPAL